MCCPSGTPCTGDVNAHAHHQVLDCRTGRDGSSCGTWACLPAVQWTPVPSGSPTRWLAMRQTQRASSLPSKVLAHMCETQLSTGDFAMLGTCAETYNCREVLLARGLPLIITH